MAQTQADPKLDLMLESTNRSFKITMVSTLKKIVKNLKTMYILVENYRSNVENIFKNHVYVLKIKKCAITKNLFNRLNRDLEKVQHSFNEFEDK